MASKIVDLQDIRQQRVRVIMTAMMRSDDFPLSFSAEHCAPARRMLGWSVEALAFKSGISPKAIRELEREARPLRRVSMQALSHAFEREQLVFLPGQPPLKGANCGGATLDPRERPDYHLIE
jgi:hypothetical protein